jgi:hypothetical protein
LAQLNLLLLERCRASQQHTLSGRGMTIGAAMEQERAHLLPLAEEGFALEEILYPIVDGHGRVRVKLNWYSTPLPAGVRTMVKVWPSQVEVFRDFECVARPELNWPRNTHDTGTVAAGEGNPGRGSGARCS